MTSRAFDGSVVSGTSEYSRAGAPSVGATAASGASWWALFHATSWACETTAAAAPPASAMPSSVTPPVALGADLAASARSLASGRDAEAAPRAILAIADRFGSGMRIDRGPPSRSAHPIRLPSVAAVSSLVATSTALDAKGSSGSTAEPDTALARANHTAESVIHASGRPAPSREPATAKGSSASMLYAAHGPSGRAARASAAAATAGAMAGATETRTFTGAEHDSGSAGVVGSAVGTSGLPTKR